MAGEVWPGTPLRQERAKHRGRSKPLLDADPNSIAIEDQRASGISLTGEAVDGDTLERQSGPALRLYGADAPEAEQQGWDRGGNPVPIGRRATAALDELATPEAVARDYMGTSYGRPVATVDQAGQDVGRTTIRAGNALAAPEYMPRTPELRGGYLEAERLARQNRLGVHGVYAQTPAEFRRDPDPSPDRETVAQFWDTPTPFAGLRPDIERGYAAMLKTGSADDILGFAKANGFTLDPADVRGYVKDRDAGKRVSTRVTYADNPAPLTNQGDGASGSFARGLGDGVLPMMLDEAGAVVDTLGGTEGRENVWNSDRRLADIVANNWRQNEAVLGYDDLAHPYARLGGEVVGGLALPFGLQARTVPELAKVGAGYGFAYGFGSGDTLPERLIRGTAAVPVGAAGGAAAGKALQYALPKLAAGWRWARGNDGQPVAVPDESLEAATGVVGGRAAGESTEAAAATPGGPVGLPDGVSPPPEGFTVDAMPMAADADPVATRELRQPDYLDLGGNTRPLLRDPTEAELRAAGERIQPSDVLPIPSNEIGSLEEAAGIDAGRIVEAKAPNERDQLTRRTVRGWNGSPVPKVGPIDLVGFLRLRGGLKEYRGELAQMGLDNRARKMDFAGREARFGPLVNNESGSNLDDAAFAAWEAGYFPELGERPDLNQFLDALRDTHAGRRRRFLPEDLAEIEAHDATRAERWDLEHRRFTEGPIYADRSAPAEDAQPFPPVEAYQDWPDGGPDFAGNIRLDKLDSPQDIKRALATTEQRVGFDAATRGRVTQAETERLAGELGMTADQLLARRKGQALNAEEALAARQILAKSGNELVNLARKVQRLENPGDDDLAAFRQAWMRHAAIQEQVAGATAEAGRALAQFKMAASSRAVRADVLSGLLNAGGGRDRIRQAAEVLIEAAETSPGQFNALAEKLAKPRFCK